MGDCGAKFPALNFDYLVSKIFELIGQRIRRSDLAIGSKVDVIISQCLYNAYGMTLNPSERSRFIYNLTKFLSDTRFPEQLTPLDFIEERDPKRMMGVLSWIIQIIEKFSRARETAREVWQNCEERARYAEGLRRKISTLRVNNKAEEEKRSHYLKIIGDLRSNLSDKLTSKSQVDSRVTTEGQKLEELTESARSDESEAVALEKRLEELNRRLEHLRVEVVDNPDLLPSAVQSLKEKHASLEYEINDIRQKKFQVEQKIEDFKRLHEKIDQGLVSVVRDCSDLHQQMAQIKSSLEKSDREIAERSGELRDLADAVAGTAGVLSNLERDIVKAGVRDATQDETTERTKREMSSQLDKYRFAYNSLESEVTLMEAMLKTTSAKSATEFSNKERDVEWEKVNEYKEKLQRLYDVYVQNQENLASDDALQ